MQHINIVMIAGKEVDICDIEEKEREKLIDAWNRRALYQIGYEEIKPA